MKKNKILPLLISLTLLYVLHPLIFEGVFTTHDGINHMARIATFSQSLLDGQFPVRWAGNLNFGYGSPVFIFFYPLPYIVGSFFYFLGLGAENSFKILIALSTIACFFSFFYFARHYLDVSRASLVSLLYILLPYHFLNRYVRGDIGELFALIFLPLILGALERISSVKSYFSSSFFLSVSFCGLLLSHNGISLIFTPVILLYLILFLRGRRFVASVVGLGLGAGMSAFFTVPAILESKYTMAGEMIGDFYKKNYTDLSHLIIPRWGFSPEINSPGGLSPQLGLVYVLIFVFCCFYLKKIKTKKYLFWIAIVFLAIILSHSASSFLWENIPILKLLQFPWRIVVLAAFSIVVLLTIVSVKVKNSVVLPIVLFFAVLFSIPHVQIIDRFSNPNSYYKNFPNSTYFHGEASTVWTAGDPFSYAKSQIEIIEGEARIDALSVTSSTHSFQVEAVSDTKLLDNTTYFPGWKVLVDGNEVPIEFQSPNQRGFITFPVPMGTHTVEVLFGETKIRQLSDLVSIVSIIAIIILATTKLKKFYK